MPAGGRRAPARPQPSKRAAHAHALNHARGPRCLPGFLARFEGSQCAAPLLDRITLVDTPGVLSGEKQRHDRQYPFIEVTQWFAARSDLVLLLFDPFKLVGGPGGG